MYVCFFFCVHALKLPVDPDYEPTKEKYTEAIPVGRPFEFEEKQLDATAEVSLFKRSINNITSKISTGSCTEGHHFFTEADCKIFSSEEMCHAKRKQKNFPCKLSRQRKHMDACNIRRRLGYLHRFCLLGSKFAGSWNVG